MNKPSMTAEQINIPQNEEERAAAIEKKRLADEAEQKSNEAARAGNGDAAPTPEEMAVEERIGHASHALLHSVWEYAQATGNMAHHVNAVLFTAAVIVANAKTHGEQVRIIEYISKTAADMTKKANENVVGQTNQPKGH